ncbi:MAG: glycosyltransferase [Candidatus Chisholmbacteria bacterium]|nr:glycosyltransferase [Candidatus Chisholmbacteria bacterium]
MNLALVYDRINKWGGAERLLTVLHQMWPDAPVYTGVYNPSTAPWAKSWDIRPSFLNHLPGASIHHEWYFWLTPLAFETLDLSSYDVVLSICSESTKAVLTRPEQLHLSYIFSPTRYLWITPQEYHQWSRGVTKPLLPPILSQLRHWDYLAARRPDHLITISQHVRRQIQKYYHRYAQVIYPPVDTDFFKPATSHEPRATSYFLIVSRLVPHKNIDLVIKAFNELQLPLKIIGTGRLENRLKKQASPNIEFLGQLTDTELLGYYQNCSALIFPGEESFGLTMVEAQACGKPVIALGRGGAAEIVINGQTGILFNQPRVSSLIQAVKQFKVEHFNWPACRQNARRFSLDKFKSHINLTVTKSWTNHQANL